MCVWYDYNLLDWVLSDNSSYCRFIYWKRSIDINVKNETNKMELNKNLHGAGSLFLSFDILASHWANWLWSVSIQEYCPVLRSDESKNYIDKRAKKH